MNILGYEIRKKSATQLNSIEPTFFPLQFIQDYLSDSLSANDLNYIKYYFSVPELQAIVNYRARCFASMKVKVRNANSKEEIEKHPILDLLSQPNPLQVFDEFAKQYLISKDIFGNAFVHPVFGAKRENSRALYNLPAMNADILTVKDNINVFEMTDIKEIVKEYEFYFRGAQLKFVPDEIIHFYDNLIFDNQKADRQWLKGKSKIQPITQPLENIKTAYEARGILSGNSPLGILTNRTKDAQGTTPMLKLDKEQLQEDMQKYGLSKKKWQFIVTSASVEFESMAVNMGNLKLFEEVNADLVTIANAYAFPPDIFRGEVTYENRKESVKQLYQDSIIPEAEEWLSGLSSGLGLLDNDIELYPDFSHIPSLQDDYEKKSKTWNWTVTALDKALSVNAITLEEYRNTLGKIGML